MRDTVGTKHVFIKNIRKWTIQTAARSNVSYGALKKFEQTGSISLLSLTKIAMELGISGELSDLFMEVPYQSPEEVLKEK